jgi:hypothetical protein
MAALRAAMPAWTSASRAAYQGSSSLLRTASAAFGALSMLLTRETAKAARIRGVDRIGANAQYRRVGKPAR